MSLFSRGGALEAFAGLFRGVPRYEGVYQTFEDAQAAASRMGLEATAAPAAVALERVAPDDYPVLFWLRHALAGAQRIFEVGGGVGHHFYGWSRLLQPSPTLRWEIYECAANSERGRRLAAERREHRIHFPPVVDAATGADLLLASGALCALPPSFLIEVLHRLKAPPPRLLLDKLPLHERAAYVTVRKTAAGAQPYTVLRRDAFVYSLERLGYQVLDEWTVPTLSCEVAGNPQLDVARHAGLYLERF